MPALHAGLAIVGGGPMGAWLALEATRGSDPLRAPVLLLEAGDPLERAGPLVVFDPEGHLLHGLAAGLAPLLRDGARTLAHFEAQTGRPIGHCRAGLVLVGDAAGAVGEAVDATWLERRGLACPAPARHLAEGALVDPARAHAEVLALARTRGAITRPGTTVTGLAIEDGRVVGLETDRGPIRAERVALTCPTLARELLPDDPVLAALVDEPWSELAFPAPQVRAEAGLPELPPGGLAELSADPSNLEAFFASGEPLEATHPALLDPTTGDLASPDPVAGDLVFLARGEGADPGPLRSWLPGHPDLGEPVARGGSSTSLADGRPLVGRHPALDGLWLGLGLGRAGIQLAPGLAAGLAAGLDDRPVAAYDEAWLAPGR